eukprot:gene14370-16508_t
MRSIVLVAWAWCISLLVVQTSAWRTHLVRQPVSRFIRTQPQRVTALLAKKKSLISEDLYASFDRFDDDSDNASKDKHKNKPQVSSRHSQPQLNHEVGQSALKTHAIVEELLKSIEDVDDEPPVSTYINKGKKKEKYRHRAFQQEEVEEIVIDNTIHISTHEIAQIDEEVQITPVKETQLVYQNKHQQKHHQQIHKEKAPSDQNRKDKPNSKVRFSSESTQPDFVSMGLEKVTLMFGDEIVLKDATFSVSTGERVGLVGPNGGGKSTSLKILAGELEPSTGTVVRSSANLRIAYLHQEFLENIDDSRTLKEELLEGFTEERAILAGIARLETELESTTDNPEQMDTVLEQLQSLQERASQKRCYSLDSRVLKVMNSMGFGVEDGNALVGSFSGGWKMRIGLAKILLQDPNILLLDEPTNHMDLDSVIWLEEFLQRQNIPMLVVSHDREFLDKVCNKIVDVEDGVTVSYTGNYSQFLEQRRARLLQWRERYEKQQRYIKEEERYIKKAHGDASLAQVAKSRENALLKLKNSEDMIAPPPRERKFRFRFPPAPRCGEAVLVAEGLRHGYGTGPSQTLFQNVDLQVQRGDRIGFIGPNGAGKSTLMRILMNQEEPLEGYSEFSTNSIVPAHYAQNQADALDLEMTVLETVMQAVHQAESGNSMSHTDLCALLSQFMFKGQDVYKKVSVLSGGEKARVALCKMMMQPANLLFLDEPTNHLDITSKEVLEEALQHYAGSVVMISHDRYFMSQVANTIFSFHDKTVERFDCDYHDYLEKQLQLQRTRDEAAQAQHTLRALQQLQEDLQQAEADTNDFISDDSVAFSEDAADLLPLEILQSLTVLHKFDTNTKPRDILSLAERLYDQCARYENSEREGINSGNEENTAADGTVEANSHTKRAFFMPSALSLKISSVRETHKNQNTLTLKEKISARYVSGDKYKITHAKEVLVSFNDDALKQKKKNFGGSGVTCGNLYKGIKNAKRFKDNPQI